MKGPELKGRRADGMRANEFGLRGLIRSEDGLSGNLSLLRERFLSVGARAGPGEEPRFSKEGRALGS